MLVISLNHAKQILPIDNTFNIYFNAEKQQSFFTLVIIIEYESTGEV